MLIILILIVTVIFSPLARGSVSALAFGPLQMIILAALSLWFFRMFREGAVRLKRTGLDMPLLLFSIFMLIAFFMAPYKYDSFIELVKFFNCLSIFYLVVNHIKERRQISMMVNAIIIAGALLSLFGIIQYVGGIVNTWWSNKRFLSSTYVNHNHFAGFLELCMPLCMGAILNQKDAGKKLLYIYIFAVMLAAFLLTMSRGGWVSLSISTMIMFVLFYRRALSVRSVFAIVFFVIVIGFLIARSADLNLFVSRVASYKELDFSGRLEIWKGTLKIIKDRPLLGSGLGSFIYYFPRYRPMGFNMFVNYAHNDYLQIWAEMGVFAFLSIMYMFFVIIKKGIRTYLVSQSSFKRGISFGAAIGVLSIAIHSMGDFNLRIPANAILFSVIAGIIFNLKSMREESCSYVEFRISKIALRFLRPVFAVGIFIWFLFIARFLMAETVYKMAGKAEAEDRIKMLDKAIRIMPGNNLYYKDIGRAYISKAAINIDREKYLLKGLEYYTAASKLNSMDGWAWVGQGDTLLYLGRLEEARLAYMKAVDLDPNNSYYLKKVGDIFVEMGDVEEAVSIFKRAAYMEENRVSWREPLSHKANRPDFYIKRGDYYYKSNSLKDALKMYKIAEGLDPTDESTKVKIAYVLERYDKD